MIQYIMILPPTHTSRSLLTFLPTQTSYSLSKTKSKKCKSDNSKTKNTVTKLNTNTQNHEVHFHLGIIIMKIFVEKFEDNLSK